MERFVEVQDNLQQLKNSNGYKKTLSEYSAKSKTHELHANRLVIALEMVTNGWREIYE